jgi:GTP pyrophosphokinase
MEEKTILKEGVIPPDAINQANLLTKEEQAALPRLYLSLCRAAREIAVADEDRKLRELLGRAAREGVFHRDKFGYSGLIRSLSDAAEFCRRVSPDRNVVLAMLLCRMCNGDFLTIEQIEKEWGPDVAKMIRGLLKVASLYSRGSIPESENFRRLLMAFADDIRVIIIMIVDRLVLMKMINHHPAERLVRDIAVESNYLYASLAHRLGLYSIKSDLEDMSLKYTDRETYTKIARQLNERKNERDAYIASFIAPLREKLLAMGLNFEIKGRTKSIFSIWNKIKKQKNDIDHIYDLFAIRIIIDTPPEREKSDCWLAYSVVTDMYQPNPLRMKDWISVPKSNGYESLHITVAGPEGRWVEVQIRTHRMDLVAEKGLAAHWRYKGIKSEDMLDSWMNKIRDILEDTESGPMELMRNFRMDIYDKEVFVFTPRGDLFRLPAGATLLDFAFHIHTNIGSQCVGGRVNGKHEKLTYQLHSGDTVEIQTSANQTPKADWINIVQTSKARTKIRQTLKERASKSAELGREMLMRRLKNRKIDFDESAVSKLVKKMGYKDMTVFFHDIAEGVIDVNVALDRYMNLEAPASDAHAEKISAGEFNLQAHRDEKADTASKPEDVLVIGNNEVKGMNYKFAKCCNPMFGDDVFGFISSEGVIKIHRSNCPNAANMLARYPYRKINTRWSGKDGSMLLAVLRVVGHDDIGIVTNITSIITKTKGTTLRNISIDSTDGLFHGHLTIAYSGDSTIKSLIKKIEEVSGVKEVICYK